MAHTHTSLPFRTQEKWIASFRPCHRFEPTTLAVVPWTGVTSMRPVEVRRWRVLPGGSSVCQWNASETSCTRPRQAPRAQMRANKAINRMDASDGPCKPISHKRRIPLDGGMRLGVSERETSAPATQFDVAVHCRQPNSPPTPSELCAQVPWVEPAIERHGIVGVKTAIHGTQLDVRVEIAGEFHDDCTVHCREVEIFVVVEPAHTRRDAAVHGGCVHRAARR